MSESIARFFDSQDFMPHGHCFLWQPSILWLHVGADAGIAIAYFVIPGLLLYVLHKRKDLPFEHIMLLFAGFIVFCGITHVMSIWVLWHPDYAFEGVLKACTAIISLATLAVVIKLIPRILSVPSIVELSLANDAIVNTVLDGLITINEKGLVQSFNPAAVRIFGYEPAEVINQNVKMLMPEPYHSEHDGYLQNYISTGAAKVIGSGREVSGRRKDGTVFSMELGINEMRLKGMRMFVGTIHDISERKKTDREREIFIEKLTESNSDLERFAYVCSHDLQEPLRMIASFTQRLEKHLEGALDDKGAHYMKYVTDGTTRARQLISDVLDYARVEHASDLLANVEGEHVLIGVMRDLNARIEETGAQITHDPLPAVYMQPTHLRQLLQNLIGNALKFNTETPRIHVNATQDGMFWRFEVRDNGIGIPAEYMSKIFSIFQRLHSRERYPGTGLGLALCKKVVQRYGGRIWVESKPGKGSSFFFTLPPAVKQERGEA